MSSYFLLLGAISIGVQTAARSLPFTPDSSLPVDLQYAVIFDAGSTGSRVHVFTFTNKPGTGLDLENEYYKKTRPGLSSFANKPLRAAFSLVPLLEIAEDKIPAEERPETPLLLKATAGLRLLPEGQREDILEAVEQVFKEYPFLVEKGYVSMFSGQDEGITAWITINYLLGRIPDGNTVAVLDMGGASAQVTFNPHSPVTYASSPPGFLVYRGFLENRELLLYTHSYLGLGGMAFRHSVLAQTSVDPPKETSNGTIVLESPCIHKGVEALWTYSMRTYLVRTKEGFNLEECKKVISEHLATFHVNRPVELQTQDIVAISKFYGASVGLGILDKKESHKKFSIADFKKASEKACSNAEEEDPFLCLDSSYILAFWTEGLGLSIDKNIIVASEIKGVSTSWSLGAAIQAIHHHL